MKLQLAQASRIRKQGNGLIAHLKAIHGTDPRLLSVVAGVPKDVLSVLAHYSDIYRTNMIWARDIGLLQDEVGGDTMAYLNMRDHDTFETVVGEIDRTSEALASAVEALSDEALIVQHDVSFKGMLCAWEAVAEMLEHGAHHDGKAMALVNGAGISL